MDRNYSAGFTLVELVIIIVVLGIVAAVAIPRIGSVLENSRIAATREEMNHLKLSIVGDPRTTAGGEYVNRGFEGDVGFPPEQLTDLIRKPDSIPPYDKFARLGWNGPYLDSTGQEYLYDAWDSLYHYNPASRTITSIGGSSDLEITF